MTIGLWLVRHGATDWSDAGKLTDWSDVALNEAGRARARHVGRILARTTFKGIWSSDLRRATETAHLAVGRAVADPRLRELDFGDLEGARWEDHPPKIQEALLRFDGFTAPGGESVADFRARVLDFVGGLTPGEHLAFTHGGVIRLLLRERGSERHVVPGDLVRVAIMTTATCRKGTR
jgi:probable phosphoglycerate mutase